MLDLLRSILVIVFTALLGAYLARLWQQRNWLMQQRVLDTEKRQSELKTLFDDFVRVASRRYIRTRRLLWALKRNNKELIDARLAEYDSAVLEWNEVYSHGMQAKFVRVLSSGTSIKAEIDSRIAAPFVNTGSALEKYVRTFRKNDRVAIPVDEVRSLEWRIELLSGAIFELSRTIYSELQKSSDERLDEAILIERQLDSGKYQELSATDILRAILRSRKHVQALE